MFLSATIIASLVLSVEIRLAEGLSTTHAMRDTGAVLDNSRGMRTVTCTLDEVFNENRPETRRLVKGKFRLAVKKSPRHVLVVDDEPLIRWSVAESLSDLGCDVEQAADANS